MLFFTVAILLFICGVLGFTMPRLGLIASPLLAIALGVLAVAVEQEYYIIAAPVVFLIGLAGVCWSKSSETDPWPRVIAKRILAACGAVLLVILGFALFGQVGSLGLMILLLFGGAITSVGLTSRFATTAHVISTISASMRQNLPLPMALESAAAGRSDKRAMILLRIKNWLVEGYPLSESIKRGYPKCPGYAVSLIAAGEKINQLPQAVKAIEADMLAKIDQSRKIQPVSQSYPTILLFFMFFIVLFLMTFVFPRYHQVLTELVEGTELPAATQLLMRIAQFVAYGYGWLIFIVLVLISATAYIRIRSRPRRPEKPYLTSRIGDIVKWRLPILHNSERNSSMLRLVEALSLSLNAGCTVNDAIAHTLQLDINYCFRKHLADWLSRIERGENIARAARDSGLGDALVWAFAEQDNHTNTLAILDTLASNYRSAYNRLVRLARFIIEPCETICMGLVVGFVVYAIFSPIVTIIYSITESVVP